MHTTYSTQLIVSDFISFTQAEPWVRQFVISFSPRWAGFNLRAVQVRLVMGKVALRRQVILRVLPFSPTNIIPSTLHIHSSINDVT
jgi:hypothetical protein